jgi:hypothetical protein
MSTHLVALTAVTSSLTDAGHPHMRAEITQIQWLGFALTAAVLYGLVAGLIADIR